MTARPTKPRDHISTDTDTLVSLAAKYDAAIELPVGAGWATLRTRRGCFCAYMPAPDAAPRLRAVS